VNIGGTIAHCSTAGLEVLNTIISGTGGCDGFTFGLSVVHITGSEQGGISNQVFMSFGAYTQHGSGDYCS